eukprot:scaffold5864_cov93-Skeletonema_dohrnii-CCMP3373.AAC.11
MDGMKMKVGESCVNTKIMSANNSEEKQAEDILLAAQDESMVGIQTVDGSTGTLCDAINTVFDTTDIAVVSFDFEGEACSEKHILPFTSQMDVDIARLVLDNLHMDADKVLDVIRHILVCAPHPNGRRRNN